MNLQILTEDEKKGRNSSGRFVEGNRIGIWTPERARELQRLSTRAQKEQRRAGMRRALLLATAEGDEWSAFEKICLVQVLRALEGNLGAMKFVMKIMGYQ